MSPRHKPPFTWFGGKSLIAELVWERFGDVPNYVEPFFGSGAVLFNRPHTPRTETVNDANCYLANFWRALKEDPDGVANHADWPVNEADLHARHKWLVDQSKFRQKMLDDPDYYDTKIAGWWVWGKSQWIGGGWCEPEACSENRRPPQQKPSIGNRGMGIHRRETSADFHNYMERLAARLRNVRVLCGDWKRVLGYSPTTLLGITGIFLDPPYKGDAGVYGLDEDPSENVRRWAVENQQDPKMRIAICGHADTLHMPTGWTCEKWTQNAGYRPRRGKKKAPREEVVWFSPHCLRKAREIQAKMF